MKATLVILTLALFGGTAFAQSSVAAPSQCTLTVAQSPAIRGFKLGMTLDQIKARFPNAEIGKPNEFGFLYGAIVRAALIPEAEKANFENIESVFLSFLDERLTFFSVEYLRSATWDNVRQFVPLVSARYGLSGEWDYNGSNAFSSLNCEGFQIRVEAQNNTARLSVSGSSVDATLRQRRAAKDEASRRAFKP